MGEYTADIYLNGNCIELGKLINDPLNIQYIINFNLIDRIKNIFKRRTTIKIIIGSDINTLINLTKILRENEKK